MNKPHILLTGKKQTIIKVVDNKIDAMFSLKFSAQSESATISDDWFAIIPHQEKIDLSYKITKFAHHSIGDKIYYGKLKDNKIDCSHKIVMPKDIKAYSIAIRENILFVGGKNSTLSARNIDGEVAGFYDLSLSKPIWNSIAIPDNLKKRRKSIDSILFLNDKLFLIDDVVTPKFFLVYNIKKLTEPKLEKVVQIPVGTYTSILKSVINSKYLILLSSSMGRWGDGRHISVFCSKTYKLEFQFNQIKSNIPTREDDFVETEKRFFQDVDICNDTLFIATYKYGIAKISLKDSSLKRIKTKEVFTRDNLFSEVMTDNLGDLIKYHNLNGKKVVRIKALSEEKVIVTILDNNKTLSNEIVEV